MPARYEAFLLRYWRLPDGAQRIGVQHIQSGAQASFATLVDALTWIAAQIPDDADPPTTAETGP